MIYVFPNSLLFTMIISHFFKPKLRFCLWIIFFIRIEQQRIDIVFKVVDIFFIGFLVITTFFIKFIFPDMSFVYFFKILKQFNVG